MAGQGWMTIRRWKNDLTVDAPQNLHVLVRGRMKLPPGKWTLRLSTAGGSYHAWLDGAWLGQSSAPAGPGQCWVQEYPLEGGRTVTVALHLYRQGLGNRAWDGEDGRLAFCVRFFRQDGREFRREGSWRYHICSAYSGAVTGGVRFLENFDSRRWPQGWERPRFNDRGWGRLFPARWMDARTSPRPAAGLRRGRVEAVQRRAVPGGVLLDFGRELTGTLWAVARGRAGDRLTLRFGEELDQAGRVRFDLRCGCRYEEHWTLAEGESVLHQYDDKAFRYVEVLGLDQGPALTGCWAWERHCPMEDGLSGLSCSRDQLADVFQICKNGVRCACQESYWSDVNRREGVNLEDAVIASRAQAWLAGNTDLLRGYVRDFLASPERAGEEAAGHALLFPALLLTEYEFTGSRVFLRACWPGVEEIWARFAPYRRSDGLLEDLPASWGAADGYGGVVNALWFGFLRMREKLERLLDLPRTKESQRVGAAFLKSFWRWDQKLFADSENGARCSVHANIYPACFGLTPPVGAESYERLLYALGLECGPASLYFALRGLSRMGRHEAMYGLLTREDAYGWRNMLREGASACFSDWGKDRREDTSLCHPRSSGAIPLIIEELAGVKPDPDMPSGFRFEPRLPWQWDDFALQVPFRGQLVRVEQREWRAALTVQPMNKKSALQLCGKCELTTGEK